MQVPYSFIVFQCGLYQREHWSVHRDLRACCDHHLPGHLPRPHTLTKTGAARRSHRRRFSHGILTLHNHHCSGPSWHLSGKHFPSSYFRAISDLSLSHILVKCQAYLQEELYRAFSAKDLRIFDLAEALLSLANIGHGRDGLVNYLMW